MIDDEKEFCRKLLEANPGNDWEFIHCNRVWRVTRVCPPVIFCPECGQAMAARPIPVSKPNQKNIV